VGPLPRVPLRAGSDVPTNVFLNTGHGPSGWTTCCATAAVLASSMGRQDGSMVGRVAPWAPVGAAPAATLDGDDLSLSLTFRGSLQAATSPARFKLAGFLSWLL
jgi:hypothetical protein